MPRIRDRPHSRRLRQWLYPVRHGASHPPHCANPPYTTVMLSGSMRYTACPSCTALLMLKATVPAFTIFFFLAMCSVLRGRKVWKKLRK